MSGYEEQLHVRAEMLEDTGELAAAVTAILSGASAAGLDPRALVSLQAAIRALDRADAPPSYQASHRGSGYGSDSEFLEAVSDAEDQIRDRLQAATQLQEQATAAAGEAQADLDTAQRDLQAARADLAAAHAMPTRHPCTGCHGAKTAAIAAGEDAIAAAGQRITEATRRIRLCEDVTEILGPLAQRLQNAWQALRQAPHDLGEVYELIYQFIRRGGKMPRPGRWIQGQPSAPLPPGVRPGHAAQAMLPGTALWHRQPWEAIPRPAAKDGRDATLPPPGAAGFPPPICAAPFELGAGAPARRSRARPLVNPRSVSPGEESSHAPDTGPVPCERPGQPRQHQAHSPSPAADAVPGLRIPGR